MVTFQVTTQTPSFQRETSCDHPIQSGLANGSQTILYISFLSLTTVCNSWAFMEWTTSFTSSVPLDGKVEEDQDPVCLAEHCLCDQFLM